MKYQRFLEDSYNVEQKQTTLVKLGTYSFTFDRGKRQRSRDGWQHAGRAIDDPRASGEKRARKRRHRAPIVDRLVTRLRRDEKRTRDIGKRIGRDRRWPAVLEDPSKRCALRRRRGAAIFHEQPREVVRGERTAAA